MHTELPALPLSEWRATRDALHGFARVLGRIRRALTPPQKHWWHITLSVSTRGLTTTPMPTGVGAIEMTLNATKDRVEIVRADGAERSIPLAGHSARSLHAALAQGLSELEIVLPALEGELDATQHAYDSSAASCYAKALSAVDLVFKEFKGTLREETSPVQLFPHHFDLSCNWFSGRRVPGIDPADADNSDEQMNFGFVTGDSSIGDAYFYATAYPLPDGLTHAALPADAYWHTQGFTGAILRYDAIAEKRDGRARLLEFLVAAQGAGAERMRRTMDAR